MFSLNHLKFFFMGDNPSVQKSVLKYYHVDREPNNKGQYIAKCRYCDSKIVGYTHTSTNCLRHIRRVHKDVMSEHEFVPKKKCVQTLQKYTANDAKQQELTGAVLNFIVHQLLPLSVVESDAFKRCTVKWAQEKRARKKGTGKMGTGKKGTEKGHRKNGHRKKGHK